MQQNLLSTNYVPDIVLGARDAVVKQTASLPRGISSLSFDGYAEIGLHLCAVDNLLGG